MQELLDLILKNITTHPDDVVITSAEEEGMTVFTITVNPEDMGRVIGKNGKVIRAIRSLAHVVGIRKNQRYRVNVAEVEGAEAPQAEATDADEAVEEMPAAPEEAAAEPMAEEATPEEPAPSQPETAESATDEDIIAGAIDIAPEDSKKA